MNRISLPVLALLFAFFGRSTCWGQNESRTWSDASGRFKVEAKLIDRNETHIKILKPDGKAVSVPIKILSKDDQKYLEGLDTPDENPFAGGVPMQAATPPAPSKQPAIKLTKDNRLWEATSSGITELPKEGREITFTDGIELSSLRSDPCVHHQSIKFAAGQWELGAMDAYVKVSQPILVDPVKGAFAFSSNRVSNAVRDETFGRIHLVGPAIGQANLALDLPVTLKLMDHHVDTDRSLAIINVGSNTERGGDLILFGGLNAGNPEPLARWQLPDHDKPGFKPKVEYASLIDEQVAVVIVNTSVYCWNLGSGECMWKIGRINSGAKAKVSHGGKYLAVPHSGKVRFVEIETGDFLGSISLSSSLTPAVSFSPNGEKLAIVGGNQYVVWDFAEARSEFDTKVGTAAGKLYGWVGNEYIFTQLGGLVDPNLRLSLWSYGMPSGGGVYTVPGGAITIHKDYKSTIVHALNVPHAAAKAAAKMLSGGDDKLMALVPGSVVKLEVDAPGEVNKEEMLVGLTEAVERAGWKIKLSAPITVSAKIERGDEKKYNFREMGTPMFRGGGTSVTIKPYKASVKITQDGQQLWSMGSSNMVPFLLRLEKGQTIQQKMKEYEQPNVGYFKRLSFPPRILKADISKKVGRSRISKGTWHDY